MYGKAATVPPEAGRQARLHPSVGTRRAHPGAVRHLPAARLHVARAAGEVPFFTTGGNDMSKLFIAVGIALATAGLAACESLDKKGVSRETQGTVGGAVA